MIAIIYIFCFSVRIFSSLQSGTFTLGNMAYHSDSLYIPLRKCIPLLVKLLSDPVSKIRYNSVGKYFVSYIVS